MSAILGPYQFDIIDGPPPPAVKGSVDLLFRPGQQVAAAKIFPPHSQPGRFSTVHFTSPAQAHNLANIYRTSIGQQLTCYYHGRNYGVLLVTDVTVVEIASLLYASGRRPNGSTYTLSPAARVAAVWDVVRLR